MTPAPQVPTGILIRDSRRLTGPNLLQNGPGAVIDAGCPDERRAALVEAWREEARRLLDAVFWEDERLAVRLFAGGASLAFSAPVDALYAATEVNETAFHAAAARVTGGVPPDLEATAERLREVIAGESHPALLALRGEALRRGVAFLSDDERVSVGLGRGSRSWPVRKTPAPDDVDWESVHDVPVALVTGTNGKTTTVRLLQAVAAQAGKVAGITCTDGIEVGGETVDRGDYSGPGGARSALRDPRVEVAFLETARGGMLRRGLAVSRAEAALVTNVGQDHLGEWGVADFEGLVETKLIVSRAVREAGLLVLNADDAALRRRGPSAAAATGWYSAGEQKDLVLRSAAGAARCAWRDGEDLTLSVDGRHHPLPSIAEIPIALGGAARHNVSNALAAATVASALGFSPEEIGAGLKAFRGDAAQNPGRGNLFDLGGAMVLVDFAHNPHGLRALLEMAGDLPARRRLILIGQAGDRDDESIRELVSVTWKSRPDRIVIKEMKKFLRGREEGEVAGLMEAELRKLGAGDDMLERAGSEMEGARSALRWARPGDLLLLLSHADRSVMLRLMARLRDRGWKPGQRLP